MFSATKILIAAAGAAVKKYYISLSWPKINPNTQGTAIDEQFGWKVATSDLYTIAGAHNEDDAGGGNSGKAYIIDNSTGVVIWTLDNPNAYSTSLNDNFGYSVAISDNYAIVGAPSEDDAGGLSSGKAYVFNPATGALIRTIDNPNAYSTSASDNFGYSVAISDTYTVVSAPGEGDAGGTSSGKVYIFNTATGALLWTLDNPNAYDTSAGDNFGYRLATSGLYTIAGANFEDDAGGAGSGKAYVFNNSTGALVTTLHNPNAYGTSANDNFGYSVGVSNKYLIVGAHYEDDVGGVQSGKAYIYNDAGLLWTLDNPNAYDTSANDNFGRAVAISDTYAIVGAYLEDEASGSGSGKAYIFDVETGLLVMTLDNPNAYLASASDLFGLSVAISDTHAVVGALGENNTVGDSNSGMVYIYKIEEEKPTYQLKWPKADPNLYTGVAGVSYFGWHADISASYIAISARNEADPSGSNSGKVYIFDKSHGGYIRTISNPNAYSTSVQDYFGQAVEMTDTYLAVSAHSEDDASGTNSGKVYIFDPSTGTLLRTIDNPNPVSTSTSDFFGNLMAMSDSNTYLAIASSFEDNVAGDDAGRVYLYNPATGGLLRTISNPNAFGTVNDDWFGNGLAINDSYLVISASYEDDATYSNSGKVYIFNPATGALIRTIDNPNPGLDSKFGLHVSLSTNYLIVATNTLGATGETVYVFNPATGALIHTFTNAGLDSFGTSISCTDEYALVTSSGQFISGRSGKGYVYDMSSGALVQTLDYPELYRNGDGAQYFGTFSIMDGDLMIIGAFAAHYPNSSEGSGAAFIYEKFVE